MQEAHASRNPSDAEKKLHRILKNAHSQGLEYEEAFESFDKDGDGQISHSEFARAVREIFAPTKISLSSDELHSLLQRFDANRNGYIGMTDFVQFARQSRNADEQPPPSPASLAAELRKVIRYSETQHGLSLREAFAAFDKQRTGRISHSNFESMLRELGFHPTAAEMKALFDAIDEDRGGSIEIMEFDRWIHDTPVGSGKQDQALPASLEAVQRKCKKALDLVQEESSTFDIEASFLAFDRNHSGEVSVAEFRYILMDMRLQLLEDDAIAIPDSDMGGRRSARVARQISRIAEWQDSGSGTHSAKASQGMQKVDRMRSEDLQIVRRFRESRKRVLAGSLLKSNITTQIRIFPSFGQTMFFEHQFHNPYAHEERFFIECKDPECYPVCDSSAWQHYRDVLGPCAGSVKGPVEHELLAEGSLELTLRPFESVSVPFVFLSFAPGMVLDEGSTTVAEVATEDGIIEAARPDDGLGRLDLALAQSSHELAQHRNAFRINQDLKHPIRRRTISVRFNSAHHGHTVALLQVHVRPRPFVVHRTFRFHQAENEYLERRIRIPNYPGQVQRFSTSRMPSQLSREQSSESYPAPMAAQAKFVHCPASDVLVEWQGKTGPNSSQEVYLRYRCRSFPSFGQFFVLVYNDQFHATLEEIWHVTVQSMLRLDVHSTLGQAKRVSLTVKGDSFSRRVQCFSSCRHESAFHPSSPFQLVSGAYNKIEMVYKPLSAGAATVRVHMIDIDSRELVAAWLIHALAQAPAVSRTYDVSIPVGKSAHKKICYRNRWARSRYFSLGVSEPRLVKVKNPQLSLSSGRESFIRLWFSPVLQTCSYEAFVFVNDEDGQSEECLLLRVNCC